ncbi:uncharacterized protein L203_100772 [Cryptococcus depauperatus CBS 7841]|uniref:Transcription initiation factor TFIID subunit 1 n=1 Tax=Cryptococcus depauperatus CBS 7841 TaxID=1295531 RepID=A0AAJ8JNP0_9TREE
MASENDTLSSIGSLGLSRILASAGIDPSSLSSFLGETGTSSKELAEVELEEDDGKFEDDISDNELPEEAKEDRYQQEWNREVRRREEERWMKKGLELMRKSFEQEKDSKGKRKAEDGKTQAEKELDAVLNIWPDFAPGKRLKMCEIIYETPADVKAFELERKRRRLSKKDRVMFTFKVASPLHQPIQSAFLLSSLPPLETAKPGQPNYNNPIGSYFDKAWVKEAKERKRAEMTVPPIDIVLKTKDAKSDMDKFGRDLDLVDWEQGIVLNSLELPEKQVDILAPRNDLLEAGDWVTDVIWDATRVSQDLFESDDEQTSPGKSLMKSSSKTVTVAFKDIKLDPFNISNDGLYEHSKEAKSRIRQTFGAIEVFHSIPAKILQLPFYRTTLSKQEARAWHRPAIHFPIGITCTFSKLKSNPSASLNVKKKQMLADPSEKFKTTKDLTLTERGPFVLLELSEEYPPIMSNFGMGTTIVNYYRKIDDKDETVPKMEFGQPSILSPGDAEPFLLGYVDKGKITQVIHNNLIRAPIFRHKPEPTDFLCIRQTINGHSTYHLRSINNIFTVGQTVPNESEIHGPHARKNTNTAKMRLMIIAWLLINKSKQKRFKIGKLLKYFPDQTELQMRQRLKVKGNEFLMYSRSPGPNQGYWQLNPEYSFPEERRQVLEMCPPEHACLYEAMQAGARHLYDAGYKKTAEGGHEDEDESNLDIEQRLAVWSITHNYKLAEVQKAWLMIHGEGDPTSRGEGFSFLRANMKNYFLRKGETEQGRRLEAEAKAGGTPVKISNAEQNRIYEEEKRKIWDLQWQALSSPIPPELTAAEEEAAKNSVQPIMPGLAPRIHRGESRRAFSRGMSRGTSIVPTPRDLDSPRDRSPSVFSMDGGESSYAGNPLAGKVLRIKRMVKGKQQVEIVRDQGVIAAYLKRIEEKKIEYYIEHPEELAPTGDNTEDELRKAALRQLLEKNKLNQQRRLMRKKYQSKTLEMDTIGIEGVDLEGKRKCGACGAIGHTKANRNCPMFGQTAAGASVGPSPSHTASATPGYGGAFVPTTLLDPNAPATQHTTSFKIKLGGGQ